MSFFKNYINNIFSVAGNIKNEQFENSIKLIKEVIERKGKIILAGNGGSSAISSHVSVDFSKAAGVRAINFNEADLITCLSNDYGYENWIEKALEFYADAKDLVILISSSGKSQNIINAAERTKELAVPLITFSGFDKENKLRKLGIINFWVDSKEYNVVEMTHHIWLLAIVDRIIAEGF